jgi:hypothetical protein
VRRECPWRPSEETAVQPWSLMTRRMLPPCRRSRARAYAREDARGRGCGGSGHPRRFRSQMRRAAPAVIGAVAVICAVDPGGHDGGLHVSRRRLVCACAGGPSAPPSSREQRARTAERESARHHRRGLRLGSCEQDPGLPCDERTAILAIVNAAAEAYRGVIPAAGAGCFGCLSKPTSAQPR